VTLYSSTLSISLSPSIFLFSLPCIVKIQKDEKEWVPKSSLSASGKTSFFGGEEGTDRQAKTIPFSPISSPS
jgi:hypothetical protein